MVTPAPSDFTTRALGIDFGTSHTRVSYFNQATNDAALLRFRDYDDLRQYSIPSMVVWNGEDWLFGYEAEDFRRSLSWDSARYREFRSLKRQMFPASVPRMLIAPNGPSISVDEAVGKFLRYAVQLADEALRSRFEGFEIRRTSIAVSVPVLFDEIARRRLRQAYQSALGREGEPSLIVHEPTAAAFAGYRYVRPSDFPSGGTVVFDAGAGSTDITVFNCVAERLFILASTAAAAGGDDIDDCLLQLLAARLRNEATGAPNDLDALFRAQLRQIRESKERLSRNSEDLCVVEPRPTQVRRSEFEAAIESDIRLMLQPLERALRGAFNTDQSFRVHRVLLAGGSSYIPFVQEKVRSMTAKIAAEHGHTGEIDVVPVTIPTGLGMVIDPVLAAVAMGTSYPRERFAEVCLGSVPYEVALELGEPPYVERVFDGYEKLPADNTLNPVRIDSEKFHPRKGAVVLKQGEVVRHRIDFVDSYWGAGHFTGLTLCFYVDISELGTVRVRRGINARAPQELLSEKLPFNELIPWNPHPAGRRQGLSLSERMRISEPDDWR